MKNYGYIKIILDSCITLGYLFLLFYLWYKWKVLRTEKAYIQGSIDTLTEFQEYIQVTYEDELRNGIKVGYEQGFMEAVKLNDIKTDGNSNTTGV